MKKFYYKDAVNDGLYVLNKKSTNPRHIEITQNEFYSLKEKNVDSETKIRKQIFELQKDLSRFDYIGIKIATGRATREEYSAEIAKMTELANQINSLREQLKSIK